MRPSRLLRECWSRLAFATAATTEKEIEKPREARRKDEKDLRLGAFLRMMLVFPAHRASNGTEP